MVPVCLLAYLLMGSLRLPYLMLALSLSLSFLRVAFLVSLSCPHTIFLSQPLTLSLFLLRSYSLEAGGEAVCSPNDELVPVLPQLWDGRLL